MCGCPARGCLEAIPSGGEYKSTVSASRPFILFLKVVVVGGGIPVFGQMIISERAECVLLADCMEKPFSGPVQRILTSNSCVAEKAGRSFSPPCSGPSIILGHVVMRRGWLLSSDPFTSARDASVDGCHDGSNCQQQLVLERKAKTLNNSYYRFCFPVDDIAEGSGVQISCAILGMFQEVIECMSLSGLLMPVRKKPKCIIGIIFAAIGLNPLSVLLNLINSFIVDTEKHLSMSFLPPPAAPDFSRDNMLRCRGVLVFVKFPQLGFGTSHRNVDVSLITNSATSRLLGSFCNVELLFLRYLHGRMTELFWPVPPCLSELLHFLVARLACGPGAVQNHEQLLVSFTRRAAAKHAGHRAEVVKRTEHRLLAPVTHRQGCQIPAATHFKELT